MPHLDIQQRLLALAARCPYQPVSAHLTFWQDGDCQVIVEHRFPGGGWVRVGGHGKTPEAAMQEAERESGGGAVWDGFETHPPGRVDKPRKL